MKLFLLQSKLSPDITHFEFFEKLMRPYLNHITNKDTVYGGPCLDPKEPPTGTQACSPCCTPTWSRRMRHWSARACGLARSAARDGAREHAALGAIRSGTRNAKWARGSRSQTHRRAAKGGFTQTTVRWSEGLVPDRRPPPLFLRCFSSCDFFINVSQY